MSKVRINDLARELEVKSKAILDALPIVGVTEKKTHSSSLEEHEAEKVRAHIRGSSEAQSLSARSARTLRGEEEIKTKIDLSHISRPGDVLKAITQKKEAAAAPTRPAAPPVAAKPVAVPPAVKATPPPAAPPAPQATVAAPAARPAVVAPPAEKPAAPVTPAAAAPAVPAPPRPAPPPAAVAPPTPSVTASTAPQPPAAAPRPVAPLAVAVPPQPPAPRMIVPQTGPRPVYKAPPPRPVAPTAQISAPAGTSLRPAPERPVPGQPVFQRPRPQVAGGGPPRPLRPGERRPMHPTRQAPAGARPLGVGPGLPPPGPSRPGSRPGAPARRPGQRYVPRGVKEGPMKGYTPPPRMVVSNEPMPITRNITITEGISVKDLAEKLDIRAKDLISRLLGRGVFATINQTLDAELASEMARFFGAETNVITFEEQASKDIDAAAGSGEESAIEVTPRPPGATTM